MSDNGIDYRALVAGARVHGSLYRDPQIFAREEAAIWRKLWIYVGHESEVKQPGDYVRRQLGQQPVLMIRGDDGQVHVLFNRCRHRGNLVCVKDRGSAETLRCPYHGWSYSRSGELVVPSFEEAYGRLDRASFSLTPAPRQAAYRGLVFASAAAEGPGLDAHLGAVKAYLDLFLDVSPTGEIELDTGVQKLRYRGNWKFLPENSLEGDYHGPFIHQVAFELHSRRSGLDMSSLYENQIPDVIRSLPGGHMVEDYRGATMAPPKRPPSPARLNYVAMMEARYGAEKAGQLTRTIPPLIYVFPNLICIMTHLRRLQPVSVGETFVYYQPMLLKGAPDEVNEARLREHEFGFGPAGLISPDDIEIMERNQRGVEAQGNDWQFIGRGARRERHHPSGEVSGFTMDECHLRGMWQHYAALMSAP